MDLLGNEPQKKQKTNGQKIVLMLLILLILASIFIVIMILALKDKKPKTLGLNINGKDVQITQTMLVFKDNGVNYISLEELSKLIGYNYLRGGYGEYEEDNTKCYLEKENQIIGFEAKTNKIYKTNENSKIDYEYYNLKNEVIQLDGILYIALDDLLVGCNVLYTFSEEEYKIKINTVEELSENYEDSFEKKGLKINDEFNNKEAIAYDMVVVSNEGGKLGVVDKDTNIIIGHKYSTMQFDEFSQKFIVSNENKYGVISKKGNIALELKYQDIRIINYSPLLYEVKLNNKVGVLDEKGEIVINIVYDKIGTSDNNLLIIRDFNKNQKAIVVSNQGKYGLIDIETGKTILNCSVEKIYSRTDNSGSKQYYVQIENREEELNKYIEQVNTIIVTTN